MKPSQDRFIKSTQRDYLHDATTTLQVDPDDEVMSVEDFFLVFDSQKNATAVARLAVSEYRKQFSQPKCVPAVLAVGNKYHATMQFTL